MSQTIQATLPPSSRWRLLAQFGSAFVASAAGMLPILVDRVIVCPFLSRCWDDAAFGGFIWAVGVIYLFGACWSNGIAMAVLRHYADLSASDRAHLVPRIAAASTVGTLACVGVAALTAAVIGPEPVTRSPIGVLTPLVAFALARSIAAVQIAVLRVQGRFHGILALRGLESAVLLLVFVLPSVTIPLVGLLYTASAAACVPVAGLLLRSNCGSLPAQPATWLRGLGHDPFFGAGMTILDQSQAYTSRIVLGCVGASAAEVAHLYAATSVGGLFLMPVTMLGGTILSLAATRSARQLTPRFARQYLAAALVAATVLGGASDLLGRLLVGWMYPNSVGVAGSFFHWIALGNAGTAAVMLLRPMGIRYTSLRATTLAAAAAVAVQLVSLLLLVPLGGAYGAAMAIGGANLAAAAAWCLMYRATLLPETAGDAASDSDSFSGQTIRAA